MFYLYKFNKLNNLFLKISEIIQKKPLDYIFDKEIIIHDNAVLFQYLNIFIANNIGISAGFKLINPSVFIWQILHQITSLNQKKSTLKKTTIIWKIIKIIEEDIFFKNINKNNNKIKKFEFASYMENLFQKYILYRPHWIQEWKKIQKISNINLEELWQIKLLNLIVNNNNINESTENFSNLFFKFNKLIKKKIFLPKRIFVIWSISINPSYIEIFNKVSIHTDVYFLYLISCKNNIINDNIDLYCKLSDTKLKNNFNTLEELWSKYEHIYLLFIKKFKNIKVTNYFETYNNNNLLNHIKNNILNYKTNKQFFKKIIHPKDNSISINICYNKQHEIEVLYKTLVKILNKHKDIKPHDIVVTSFSINTYKTYINSVFKLKKKEEQIPFYISEKHSKDVEKILYLFNKILNIPNTRFNNEEILELLHIPAIAQNFSISEKEINILYNWIKETNIRWGVNEKHKNDFFSLNIQQNTWFYGINKLLLSYAINRKNKIWNNILSSTSINSSKSELIEKLFNFINTLNKWRLKLLKTKKIKYWRLLFQCFINDFLKETKEWNKILKFIDKNWIKMIDEIIQSTYQKKIPINVLQKNFLSIINNINYKKFKIGVINFCHPSLVCYIPFKIIYVIGLDYKAFTEKDNMNHVNLLKKYPLITDIDNIKYYLLFQNFFAATEYFYMSYIGYSLKYQNKLYPSIFIDELINYITLYFCFKGDEYLKIEENIKKISKHIFKKHKKEHIYNIIKVKKIKCIKTNKIKKINQIFFKEIIKCEYLNKQKFLINLKDLVYFWQHPIRYFFNFTLKTRFLINNKLLITEPFIIDSIENFKINHLLLETIIYKKNIENVLEQVKLSGILPHGNFGEVILQKKYIEMEKIAKTVNKYRIISEEKKINFKIEKYLITGILKEVQNTGLIRWKSNSINYADRISLWIEHLIYSILGGTGESKIIGYKNQIFAFNSIPQNTAYNYFLKYIKGYIEGIKNPLLLTKSGAAWLDKAYDIKNHCIYKNQLIKKESYKKLYNTWMGNSYIQGEKEDIYIQQIISKLDVKKICKISQKWLIPLLKHKKNYEKKIKYI